VACRTVPHVLWGRGFHRRGNVVCNGLRGVQVNLDVHRVAKILKPRHRCCGAGAALRFCWRSARIRILRCSSRPNVPRTRTYGYVRESGLGVSVNLGGAVRTQNECGREYCRPLQQTRPWCLDHRSHVSGAVWRTGGATACAPFSGESSPTVSLPGTVVGQAHHQCGHGQ
jgi:hypothetical protein